MNIHGECAVKTVHNNTRFLVSAYEEDRRLRLQLAARTTPREAWKASKASISRANMSRSAACSTSRCSSALKVFTATISPVSVFFADRTVQYLPSNPVSTGHESEWE